MAHTFKSDVLKAVVNGALKYFMEAPIDTIPPSEKFQGGGVYALYYLGDSMLYMDLKLSHVEKDSIPIYVGKAVPRGWRTARATSSQGRHLYRRIREHFRNLVDVENLDPRDFQCRYMVLDDDESGIIGPVEAALIRKFQPLWNTVIDGFGNHTPGEGRFNQAKSGWDVLHPGRAWAERCTGQPPEYDDLVARISAYTARKNKAR